MVRRSAYLAAGPYDRRLTNLQDLDMWIRLLKSGELHVLPDRLISFRVRDNNANLSAPRVDSQLRSNFEYAQVLNRVLDFDEAQIRQAFAPELASLALSQTMSKAQLAAEIALQAGGVPHRLFALQTLYAAARSDADFQRLKEVTGSTNVFNLPVDPTLRF